MTISCPVHRLYAIIGISLKFGSKFMFITTSALHFIFCSAIVNYIKTTLLKNRCLSVSFLDLLSSLTKDKLRRIWQYDANIKIGWVHDEVKNSYFSVIWKNSGESVILPNYRSTIDIACEVFSYVLKKPVNTKWKNFIFCVVCTPQSSLSFRKLLEEWM